ncbi:hypothetical protein PHSY_001139 [Pseudozyma hubeiensis SY62]|uniref:Uncharacterized protein n=1 Tax=Pseudozyma hubeiensis (strain SY62) TaxID=1305764 RepID=R9NY29_PSEHS|nr:hypothetical protein PHSY_001139 [Pseudozyma hubeiensis SY62]GAC93574.1 hypothetical protein PHSY_001139 [Pseudozyma hubeiensis SY62]
MVAAAQHAKSSSVSEGHSSDPRRPEQAEIAAPAAKHWSSMVFGATLLDSLLAFPFVDLRAVRDTRYRVFWKSTYLTKGAW